MNEVKYVLNSKYIHTAKHMQATRNDIYKQHKFGSER